jgi:uncharacterized protein YcfJ
MGRKLKCVWLSRVWPGVRVQYGAATIPAVSTASDDLPMNNQILLRAVAVSLALTAGTALVGCNEEAANTATVASGKSVGREECHDEVVTHTVKPKDKNQIAGTAIGAVIGGVVGNQVGGKGDSKKVATAAGAVAGGYAGNKIQENAQEKNTYQETKRTCRMVYN